MVNRIWQGHFGEGIVRTPNDFGRQGDAPTHPELLDWLAVEFAERGWSIKQMHRLIMLSSVYRASSVADEESLAKDPENHFLSRMPRRRLDGDSLRDTILAVAGTLNLKMGGVGVIPPLTREEILAARFPNLWPANPDPAEHNRRSVYLQMKRSLTLPMLQIFDAPDTATSCPRRERSTVAPQALALMNGESTVAQADQFAARITKLAGDDPEAAVETGWKLAFGRTPTAAERADRAGLPAAQFPAAPLPSDLQHERVHLCRLIIRVASFLQNAGHGHWLAGRPGSAPAERRRRRDAPSPLAPKKPPLPATAKSVISLFMQGGPSQVDTYDPKPLLAKLHGQHPPESFGNEDFQNGKFRDTVILGSKRTFKKYGQSGIEVSDLFPHTSQVRGRPRHHSLVLSRRLHALAGAVPDQQRLAAHRPSQPRLVDPLRTRQREPEPARLRRPAGRRRPLRARRSTARASSPPPTRARRSARAAIRFSTSRRPRAWSPTQQRDLLATLRDTERAAPGRAQSRFRAGRAHGVVRARLPHADVGARSHRRQQRIRSHQEAVRPGRSRPPPISAAAACWRAAWWSAAFASSRCGTATA